MNYIVDKAMKITPLLYRPFVFYRYVDDCFSVFDDKKSVIEFEKILNSIHPKIAFTTELQSNNRLSFLNVLVSNSGPNPATSKLLSANPLLQDYTQNGTVLYLVDLK